MPARIPLDIDLEDRIVYGLTPIRLAYAVLSSLASMTIWSQDGVPGAVRVPLAAAILAIGGALAWGRWRSRPLDGWFIDFALYVWSTRRLRWRGL
jgi:hypothetical protein